MWAYGGLAVQGFRIAAGAAVGSPATCAGLDEHTQYSDSENGDLYCSGIIRKYVQ
jgi:hypothetical protein